MQEPNILLTVLTKMAEDPEVKFDQLYPKLYNVKLWLMAYERIAPKPGNLTPGIDGKTIDGMGGKLIEGMIADLKASRYTPKPVRRVYIPKANGKLRPLGIPMVHAYCTSFKWCCELASKHVQSRDKGQQRIR